MTFVLAVAVAIAATPSPSPSPSSSAIPQIAHVVTSDRSVEPAARAARTTYVVTATDMARNGDRTIADALQNVPGVTINRYGAFGAQTNFGIRGSTSEQVLVLLDGLPVAGAQILGMQLEGMPVAGVDRVEVVEGGGSTLYGSGSMGGVINIISTQPRTSSAILATGSFGNRRTNFKRRSFRFNGRTRPTTTDCPTARRARTPTRGLRPFALLTSTESVRWTFRLAAISAARAFAFPVRSTSRRTRAGNRRIRTTCAFGRKYAGRIPRNRFQWASRRKISDTTAIRPMTTRARTNRTRRRHPALPRRLRTRSTSRMRASWRALRTSSATIGSDSSTASTFRAAWPS